MPPVHEYDVAVGTDKVIVGFVQVTTVTLGDSVIVADGAAVL